MTVSVWYMFWVIKYAHFRLFSSVFNYFNRKLMNWSRLESLNLSVNIYSKTSRNFSTNIWIAEKNYISLLSNSQPTEISYPGMHSGKFLQVQMYNLLILNQTKRAKFVTIWEYFKNNSERKHKLKVQKSQNVQWNHYLHL